MSQLTACSTRLTWNVRSVRWAESRTHYYGNLLTTTYLVVGIEHTCVAPRTLSRHLGPFVLLTKCHTYYSHTLSDSRFTPLTAVSPLSCQGSMRVTQLQPTTRTPIATCSTGIIAAVGHLLLTSDHARSTAALLLPAYRTAHRLPLATFYLLTATYQPSIYFQLPHACYLLFITSPACWELLTLLTTYYSLLTTHYSLLTTYYALRTIYYVLLTTHYSLLTNDYLLSIKY